MDVGGSRVEARRLVSRFLYYFRSEFMVTDLDWSDGRRAIEK